MVVGVDGTDDTGCQNRKQEDEENGSLKKTEGAATLRNRLLFNSFDLLSRTVMLVRLDPETIGDKEQNAPDKSKHRHDN